MNEHSAVASNTTLTTSASNQNAVPGFILRAPDGTTYFVPDRALSTFHVTSSMGKAAIQERFEAINSGQEPAAPATAYHVELADTLFGPSYVFR